MTLKLPTPLPYEYVDELIDSTVYFETWVNEEKGLQYFEAHKIDTDGNSRFHSGNYGKKLCEIRNEWDISEVKEPDEEGYYEFNGTFLYVWTSKELTEEEIDESLALIL